MKVKKKFSLFSMLIGHYILYTLTVVIVLGSLYGMVYMKGEEIFGRPRFDKLRDYKKAILNGEYIRIPVEEIVGQGGYIEILDKDLKSVYSSKADGVLKTYTSGEIQCIDKYQSSSYIVKDIYKTETDAEQIVISIASEGGEEDDEYIILDEQLKVIASNKEQNKKYYTQQELSYLTGEYLGKYSVYKSVYANGYTLLMFSPNIDDKDVNRYYDMFKHITYVFFIFYIGMLMMFVYWLKRKVKQPITLLNSALADFTQNKVNTKIDYEGPYEFVEICESFNNMAEQLNSSEMRKQELEQEKQKMLADISHDLKTPITIIQGYAKAICDGLIKEDQLDQYLTTIYHKSRGLTELINNFYEYSKLEHPEYRLSLTRYDICEYIRAYLAQKYNEIEILGYNLEVDIPDQELMCEIDTIQFKRALENIIVNAIKHNEPGTTLYIKVTEEAEHISITLADNGKGVPAELAKTIFKPFAVGDESRNNKEGSGLGLAISKYIVEAHGGSIEIIVPPMAPYHTQFDIKIIKIN